MEAIYAVVRRSINHWHCSVFLEETSCPLSIHFILIHLYHSINQLLRVILNCLVLHFEPMRRIRLGFLSARTQILDQ